MIRVSVCQYYRVELRQRMERNSWSTYAGQKLAEGRVKIGIGEESFPTDLN
jgi:hypothetical protein